MSAKILAFFRVMAMLWFSITAMASAQSTYRVLHNFGGTNDGFTPMTGVAFGPDGNLYGTTCGGGSQYYGSAFQITPSFDGTWSESVIYNFSETDPLGATPSSSPVFDSSGNLYGTTSSDGENLYGVLFELSPVRGGWSGNVLHSFTDGWDGGTPGGLVKDNAGKLYGGTALGGTYNHGVVFDFGHVSVRTWYELVLHSFGGPGDALAPYSVVPDNQGNLYGIAAGGQYGWGVVFRLSPNPGSSNWTETILHSFTGGSDGGDFDANANLIRDAAGNLYGATVYGGGCGGGLGVGVVFKLSPSGDGAWSETVLYAFGCLPQDPISPVSINLDHAGNLVGESSGGPDGSQGTVFELTSTNGAWTASILHSFVDSNYGTWPSGGVVLDHNGNIYGTTQAGGTYGLEHGGVVFEITP